MVSDASVTSRVPVIGFMIERYIRFHDKRHLRELSATHVARFPSYLTTARNVAAALGRGMQHRQQA